MQTNFPEKFNPGGEQARNFITYIFEMGDFKIMISARRVIENGKLKYEDIVYNIVFMGRVLNITDEKKVLFFESVFSKVSGLDKLAAVDYLTDDVTKSKLKVVHFHKPILSIEGEFGLHKKVKPKVQNQSQNQD
jgi:hypothetical protein